MHRLWRVLTADFSLGTWFSVHVRMYWAAVILMPLIFMRRVPSASPAETLLLALICFVGLFAIIWSHEMGHIAAAWRYRIRTTKITLGPLGGVAHLNAPASTPLEELWIALAGPAVHLAWLLVFWPIEWLMPEATYYETWFGFLVWFLVVTNQTLLLFNLLPVFPLDGGRALRALLAMKVHPNRATLWAAHIGIGGGMVMMMIALTRTSVESSIGLMIGLTCILGSLNEKRAAQQIPIYGQPSRDQWASDPDAWKLGRQSDKANNPGWVARRRQARAERIALEKQQQDVQLDAQVDAILERISKVGVDGLTTEERDVLQRASRKQRGAS